MNTELNQLRSDNERLLQENKVMRTTLEELARLGNVIAQRALRKVDDQVLTL